MTEFTQQELLINAGHIRHLTASPLSKASQGHGRQAVLAKLLASLPATRAYHLELFVSLITNQRHPMTRGPTAPYHHGPLLSPLGLPTERHKKLTKSSNRDLNIIQSAR